MLTKPSSRSSKPSSRSKGAIAHIRPYALYPNQALEAWEEMPMLLILPPFGREER
jgi:hypothetical protein